MRLYLLFWPILVTYGQTVYKRFEYKYGFKPPYLAQKDGSIPFWEYAGSTMASKDNVRVTPSLKSQKGMVWNKNQVTFKWWEVELWIRVTSRGRMGADGLAFWYTTERMMGGDVFGSKDKWNGLAVIFDSYDNDNKRNNPYVSAIANDGTMSYDHDHDGQGQVLGGCMRDFRNKPHPVRARIAYLNNILTLEIHNGITNSDNDYELCFRAENVILPEHGYFGVTAATGGLADDHDVMKFLTSSLATSTQDIKDENISEQERQRLKQEFEGYEKKTEQAKADYKREHPEASKGSDEDMDDLFDPEMTRELRQIFEGQGHIFNTVKELHRKMDEIIGRQERTLSMLSQAGQGSVGQPGQGGTPQLGAVPQHEFTTILNNQQEMVAAARDIKSTVFEINQKSYSILENQKKPVGSVHLQDSASGIFDQQKVLNELRDGLNTVKRDVGITNQYIQQPQKQVSSEPSSCVSLTAFVAVGLVQLVIIVGFLMYRDSKQTQAKKFY